MQESSFFQDDDLQAEPKVSTVMKIGKSRTQRNDCHEDLQAGGLKVTTLAKIGKLGAQR